MFFSPVFCLAGTSHVPSVIMSSRNSRRRQNPFLLHANPNLHLAAPKLTCKTNGAPGNPATRSPPCHPPPVTTPAQPASLRAGSGEVVVVCKQKRALSVSPAANMTLLGSWPEGNGGLVLASCLLLASPARDGMFSLVLIMLG